MGLLDVDLQLVLQHTDIRGLRVLELGNQHVYIATPPFPGYPEQFLRPSMVAGLPARGLWLALGAAEYQCVDLNEQDGAVVADLAEPVPAALEGWANVVTDFGTSEHVRDLYAAQKWMWDACALGGLIVQANPAVGAWPEHCPWYRSTVFYDALAAALPACEKLHTSRNFVLGNSKDGWNIYSVVRRTSSAPFISRETFDALPGVEYVGGDVNAAQTWKARGQR